MEMSRLLKILFYLLTPLGLLLFALLPFLVPQKKLGHPRVSPSPSTYFKDDRDKNGIPDGFEKALAKKFNPAMAFGVEDIWPVNHRYLWARGGELRRRVFKKEGKMLRFLREEKLLKASDLDRTNWSHFPDEEKKGEDQYRYKYYIDAPGENLGSGSDEMTWAMEFKKLQGGNLQDPTKGVYPPTQYAHFYWVDWKKGILGIQYWFYYPYNKFINSHEGDWEHINIHIKLKGKGRERLDPSKPNQAPIRYHFFFHKYYIDTDRAVRVGDFEGGDHVVVFVGGRGEMLIPRMEIVEGQWKLFPISFEKWEGQCSGGSYPYLGRYSGLGGVGKFRGVEEIGEPKRLIHPRDFQVVVLPEADKIDYEKHPELSWMNLDFFSGNWMDPANSTVIKLVDAARAPLQPARKDTWNEKYPYKLWKDYAGSSLQNFQPPKGWKMIENPYFGRRPK